MILETVTGKLVDPTNPQVEQVDIEDIAWALSRISRFCGHTITVVPYTVGQHSMFVANKVENFLSEVGWHTNLKDLGVPESVWGEWLYDNPKKRYKIILKALLHDAAEIYTGDLPSPIKRLPELRPVIKRIEDGLMCVVYKAFDLTPPDEQEEKVIKYADRIAQKIEAHAFMQSRGKHWEGLPEVSLEELQRFHQPLPSLEAYREFMIKFKELRDAIAL